MTLAGPGLPLSDLAQYLDKQSPASLHFHPQFRNRDCEIGGANTEETLTGLRRQDDDRLRSAGSREKSIREDWKSKESKERSVGRKT